MELFAGLEKRGRKGEREVGGGRREMAFRNAELLAKLPYVRTGLKWDLHTTMRKERGRRVDAKKQELKEL